MAEPRVKGKSQNIGATAIRCGCGFTTNNTATWAEHRRTKHIGK